LLSINMHAHGREQTDQREYGFTTSRPAPNKGPPGNPQGKP
jgi:hypothetical protein